MFIRHLFPLHSQLWTTLLTVCYVVCAICTLTSCSSDEGILEDNRRDAIGFNTYLEGMVATRSMESNQTSIQNTGFGVLAARTTNNWTNTDKNADFMHDQKVSYSSTLWNYSPAKYWPTNGDKLSFWAYAPFGNSNITLSAADATGAPTATVSVPADGSNTVDFVTACAMNKTYNDYSSSQGKVSLSLKHEMTRVAFKIVSTNVSLANKFDLLLHSVKLTGSKLCSQGTYTFPTTDGYVGSWSSVTANHTVTLTPSPAIQADTQSEYIYLIPVSSLAAGEVKATINYSLKVSDGNSSTITIANNADIELNLPASILQQGKSYILSFDPKQGTLIAEMEKWQPETNEALDYNKWEWQ